MGDFDDRMAALSAEVGDGSLVGNVEVDQIYAHFQHEGLDLNHPRGGQAKYLEAPLYEKADEFMERLARAVLDGEGALPDAMIDNVDALSDEVERLAPLDLNNLRRSAHPTVTSAGSTIYDRAPAVPRLTEDELRALHRGHS